MTVRNSSRPIARVFRATAAPGCRDELLQRFHSSPAALVNSKVGCLKYRILEPVDSLAPEAPRFNHAPLRTGSCAFVAVTMMSAPRTALSASIAVAAGARPDQPIIRPQPTGLTAIRATALARAPIRPRAERYSEAAAGLPAGGSRNRISSSGSKAALHCRS